jgi:hypothetical protein
LDIFRDLHKLEEMGEKSEFRVVKQMLDNMVVGDDQGLSRNEGKSEVSRRRVFKPWLLCNDLYHLHQLFLIQTAELTGTYYFRSN